MRTPIYFHRVYCRARDRCCRRFWLCARLTLTTHNGFENAVLSLANNRSNFFWKKKRQKVQNEQNRHDNQFTRV